MKKSVSAFGVDGIVHGYFVVTCDDYLVSELQLFEQSEKFVEMLLSAVSGEVTCADEDVSFNVTLYEFLELVELRVSI